MLRGMAAYTYDSLAAYPGTPTVREDYDGFATPYPWGTGGIDSATPAAFSAVGRGATGSLTDRKAGRDLPVFWNELDLRWYRILARWLDSTNNFAIGFLNHLVNYVVGKGYGWQACLAGQKKTPYATGYDADPLVGKAQTILDRWRDANQWPVRSRQAYRRLRRDGEVGGRFFKGGWDRLPAFRFVGPELIGSPTGDTNTNRSFGIETDPDDHETVWAYFVRDPDGSGIEGQWVDADRVVFHKVNTDAEVKRGVSDFLPMSAELDGVRRLLRAMLDTAHEQARMAWIEKFPTALVDQVRGSIPRTPAGTPRGVPDGWLLPWAGNDLRQTYVKKVEGNREFEPGPTFSGVPSYLQVEQACLRGMGARWNMPEYFSGDASNNNLASSLVAGSPFARAIDGAQAEYGAGWERPVACRVLDLAAEAGMLTADERRRLDVEVTPPAVSTPEPDKDAARVTGLVGAKILSRTTAQVQLGLDPRHEAENLKGEAEQDQQTQQPAGPGGGGEPAEPGPDEGGGDGLELLGLSEGQLVPKTVTVRGKDGKTFTRTQLVRPDGKPAAAGRSRGGSRPSPQDDRNTPNPALPGETRPGLTPAERDAVEHYTGGGFDALNAALRSGRPLDPTSAKIHKGLADAFAKVRPFDPPVTAVRTLDIADKAKLAAFLEGAKGSAASGDPVVMPGYMSTSVHPRAGGFEHPGNVRVAIAATHGLDCRPHTNFPAEYELLLDHDSMFRVKSVTKKGETWVVHMEQIPPDVS